MVCLHIRPIKHMSQKDAQSPGQTRTRARFARALPPKRKPARRLEKFRQLSSSRRESVKSDHEREKTQIDSHEKFDHIQSRRDCMRVSGQTRARAQLELASTLTLALYVFDWLGSYENQQKAVKNIFKSAIANGKGKFAFTVKLV